MIVPSFKIDEMCYGFNNDGGAELGELFVCGGQGWDCFGRTNGPIYFPLILIRLDHA